MKECLLDRTTIEFAFVGSGDIRQIAVQNWILYCTMTTFKHHKGLLSDLTISQLNMHIVAHAY